MATDWLSATTQHDSLRQRVDNSVAPRGQSSLAAAAARKCVTLAVDADDVTQAREATTMTASQSHTTETLAIQLADEPQEEVACPLCGEDQPRLALYAR